MKKEATQGTVMVEYLNENDILLNPMIKVMIIEASGFLKVLYRQSVKD